MSKKSIMASPLTVFSYCCVSVSSRYPSLIAPTILTRVLLPVVSMTLSTPVRIQPHVTFVACVGWTA